MLRSERRGIRQTPCPRSAAPKGTAVPMLRSPSIKEPRIYSIAWASLYPLYVAKAERKGRTKEEVDQILRWLTGYRQKQLETKIAQRADLRTFFADAPAMNPLRTKIEGLVCGVRVETVVDPLMREIRRLDKLIDELARGKPLDRILRS